MGIWVSSKSAARRHGVYAIAKTPPQTVRAIGTGVVALVAQLPWGPSQQIIIPAGTKEMINMFAPPGMSHTGAGYMALIGKGFPALRIIRVLPASGIVKATCVLTSTGPVTIGTVTALYYGAAGNSIVATVKTASDGDANHFDVDFTVTGASGTTTDSFKNWNGSATGTKTTPDFSQSILVGAVSWGTSGRPTNGTYTFTTGADGSVAAADYVGTPGSGDLGLALLEGDKSVRRVFTDDCGNTFRPTVNAAVKAHCELMGDRVGFINGNSGLALASVITDVANYRSERCVYVAPWAYVYDDATGAEQLVAPSGFGASVCAQISPSTSPAWKDQEVGSMLGGIVRLETDYGEGVADLTDAGVMAIEKEDDGGYRFEAGVLTIAPSTPSKRNITRTAMGDYIAVSFVRSVRSMTDAPNVDVNQISLVGALQSFMDGLVANQYKDPNHTPYVKFYSIGDLAAENAVVDLDAGDFTIPLNVKIGSSMERIFLSIQHGENVIVRMAA